MSFDEPKSTDNAMHQVMHEARDYQRIEVIAGRRRRRNWADDERAQIVAESAVPGANISDVARRWGVQRGLLTVWRREAGVSGPCGVAPGSTACGRIELEIGGGRMVLTRPVDPVVVTALVAAWRAP